MTISAGPWSGWWSATIQRLFAILQLSYSQTSSGRGWHSIQDFNKCVLHDLMFRLLHQNCSPSTSSGNHERIISLRLLASADRGKVWLLAGQMLLPVLPVRPWFAWTDLPNRPNQQRFVRFPNSLEWTRTVRVDHTHTDIYIYTLYIYICIVYIYTMICANSRSCVQKAEFRSRHLCYSPGSLRSSSQDRQSWVVLSQAWLSVLPYSRAGYSSTSGVCAAFCTAACLGLDLPERRNAESYGKL